MQSNGGISTTLIEQQFRVETLVAAETEAVEVAARMIMIAAT